MTPDELAEEARRNIRAMYKRDRAPVKKRTGKTPEAKTSAAIDKYLERLDFYVLRTSAGMATIGDRTMQIGRAGTHDRTCCVDGYYISIEIKSALGKTSPAQERQRQFIERRGGLVIIARSVDDVRQALMARFGEETVKGWER